MDVKALIKQPATISKIAIGAIFLALIRCIAEPFRLQQFSKTPLIFYQVKPFLLGSLAAALGLFAMMVFFYSGRYKIINSICILTVAVLLVIKKIYFIA